MIKFHKILSIFCFLTFSHLIEGTNDTLQYCDLEIYCTANGPETSQLHIGCPRNFIASKSNYKFLKLKYNERNLIINEINQFRSDVALGEIYTSNLTSSTFSYMKKLKWDYELEHLLQLMITKHSDSKFYCMSTLTDKTPIQMVVTVNRPQPINLEKLFLLALDDIKIKALQSYSLAGPNEIINLSQYYHPETWSFACAVGEHFRTLATREENMLIRCAFYGKKFRKSKDSFKYGELCSGCGADGCSDLFPGLCGSDFDSIRGRLGHPGIIGYPGPKGKAGRRGANGDMGEKGYKGIRGILGEMGASGMRGTKGDLGLPGLPQVKGEKGLPGKTANPEDCIGLHGDEGPIGLLGLIGIKGEIGEKGSKGERAIQTKGDRGEWGLSIYGKKGDNGNVGDIGAKGLPGETGLSGDEGDAGHISDVRFGTMDDCVICTAGPKGLQGLPGPQGPQGPDAQLQDTILEIDIVTEPNRPDW